MINLCLKTKIEYDPNENSCWGSFRYNNIMYNPIQLKDGSILIYTNDNISILDKNLKQKELISFSNIDDENSIIISKVKQIKNGKILCCAKDLYIYEIKSNNIINSKIIKLPDDEVIYDVIELKDGKLLGITIKDIFEIKNEGENFKFLKLFDIPKNCLIMPLSKFHRFYSSFKQYIDLYELPNKRLFIHLHSTEFSHNGGCGTHPPSEICVNKMFILNLDNFKIIHEFEQMNSELNIIFFDKYFCISYYYYQRKINIYDINNYKLIETIECNYDYIAKYDKNIFIGINEKENKNDIIVFNLSNINDIKFKEFEGNFMKFQKKVYNSIYPVRNSKNKSLCILKDGEILIICHGLIFIVNFPESLNKVAFYSLKEKGNLKKTLPYYDSD